MKKCLTESAQKGEFKRNPIHTDIWDLESGNLPFTYFRLSNPREPYLIQQGAVKVAESHLHGKKVLHTGLRFTHCPTIFAGNLYDPVKRKRKLLLFKKNPDETITIFLYNTNPRKIKPIVEEAEVL